MPQSDLGSDIEMAADTFMHMYVTCQHKHVARRHKSHKQTCISTHADRSMFALSTLCAYSLHDLSTALLHLLLDWLLALVHIILI